MITIFHVFSNKREGGKIAKAYEKLNLNQQSPVRTAHMPAYITMHNHNTLHSTEQFQCKKVVLSEPQGPIGQR